MKCPGQDTRYWKSGAIFDVKCPKCGKNIEFFKDDSTRTCRDCGHKFINPKMDFGCAAYCQYAAQCVEDLPLELLAKREDLLKDRVALEMKKYFKRDFKKISHAIKVAHYAERIGKSEGGKLAVILSAAYLHDIDLHEAEREHHSNAANYLEQKGPIIAKNILIKLGANEKLIEEVCDIVGHHHPRPEETINSKAVYDADLITNLEKKHDEKPINFERLNSMIEKLFLTKSGQKEARKVLLKAMFPLNVEN